MTFLKTNFCRNCKIKLNGAPDGEIFEDMKLRKKIKYSMLFEVYGGYNANLSENDNCFSIFNPETPRAYDYYVEKWTSILYEFYEKIIEIEIPS